MIQMTAAADPSQPLIRPGHPPVMTARNEPGAPACSRLAEFARSTRRVTASMPFLWTSTGLCALSMARRALPATVLFGGMLVASNVAATSEFAAAWRDNCPWGHALAHGAVRSVATVALLGIVYLVFVSI